MSGAFLYAADFTRAWVDGCSFDEALVGGTLFVDVDLRDTSLRSLEHGASSIVDRLTLQWMKLGTLDEERQEVLEEFLRGCGLSDWEIEAAKLHSPGLTGEQITDITYRITHLLTTQPIQINPLFISYSHTDGPFVDALEKVLDDKGIRFWRDVHHATAGRLEKIVDRAMRLNPVVLLVLSESSVQSDWVEHEVRRARELAKETGRHTLLPVALDDAWKTAPWPERLMDFSEWRDEEFLDKQFGKLVEGLALYY